MRDIESKIYADISIKLLDFLLANNIEYNLEEENRITEQRIHNITNLQIPIIDKNKYELTERFSLRAIAVLNFLDKLVIPIPRKVSVSNYLLDRMKNEIDENVINQINLFKKKFELGEDVNSNLSKLIFKSNSWDYALNIWNVKHLHLSTSVQLSKSAMSENRSDYLLFFATNEDNVYFIDVRKHPRGSGFTSFDFLEIIAQNNWLNAIGFHEIMGIQDLDPLIESNDDTYKLAKSHGNTFYKINNKYYMNGMGITSFGNKSEHTHTINKTTRMIIKIAKELEEKHAEYLGFDLLLNEYLGRIKYKINSEVMQHLIQ